MLLGSIIPVMAQSNSIADHVVINEIDTNPPGDDSKSISEWVELYNPTENDVDISNWEIASTTILKKTLKIPSNTIITPNGFAEFQYQILWFPDINEIVELRDSEGTVIDKTLKIADIKNDFDSWQRIADGFDTDSDSDWKFELSNAGSSNGKIATESVESSVSIEVSTDKENYILNETVEITGKVSEQVYIFKPWFQPAQIKLIISGPNDFSETMQFYPDLNLNFKTEMKSGKIINVHEGNYSIAAEYSDGTSQTQFTIRSEVTQEEQEIANTLSISTDKSSYIPGETVFIKALSDQIIPFEGMKYKVINPQGEQISGGTLFPMNQESIFNDQTTRKVFADGFEKTDGAQFYVTVFMNTVNPIYGKHDISATYGQNEIQTSFELSEDVKEDVAISLRTDKPAYGLGETVTISGRTNQVHISTLDFEILQTGTSGLEGGGKVESQVTSPDKILHVLDVLRLAGDSTFEYILDIANDPVRYGEYLVTVDKDIGSAQTTFAVVENPADYVAATLPFTISTDKSTYEVGDRFIISGKIVEQKKRSSFELPTVSISITKVGGGPPTMTVPTPSSTEPLTAVLSYTAIPDTTGNFELTNTLYRHVFNEGTYILEATYPGLKASTSITVVDSLTLGSIELIAGTDKEVYGPGEEVHVTGGITSPVSRSGLDIVLTKPDGDRNKYGALLDDRQQFSWTWTIPRFDLGPELEEFQHTRFGFVPVIDKTIGIYKIEIDAQGFGTELFFKVSKNPDQESVRVPLDITTDKITYNTGDTVFIFGNAIKQDKLTEGLILPERPQIIVKADLVKEVLRANVDIDSGEKFQTKLDLVPGAFKAGNYKVRVNYFDLTAETFFEVVDLFDTTGEDIPLALIMDLDKETYNPGDVVHVTGRTSKIVYVDRLDAVVIKDSEAVINCGKFYCGDVGTAVPIDIDSTGRFTYDYTIPTSSETLGTYTVQVKTDFDLITDSFEVVSKPLELEVSKERQIVYSKKIIEKFNRIPDAVIPVSFVENTIDDTIMNPRVLQGSLRVDKGAESDVNIQITTDSGICIIGQNEDCKVKKSTREPGKIFDVVEIDGINFKVRYSGPDVRLEKFSILPEDKAAVIPDSSWNVEVLKDEGQFSRFYYKISYVSFE